MAEAFLHGVDVSNHQPNWRPTGNEAFVFILTSDGHSWYSPTHDRQVQLVRAKGAVVGHYHWLRPGNIDAQVAWFLKHANPQPGDVLICDWEQSGTTNRDKDQFIKAVKAACPENRVELYCNRNYWLNYDRTSYVGDGLWIAVYGANDPGIEFEWNFWQYADHDGSVSLDQNHARFADKAALLAWTGGAKEVQPPPKQITVVEPIQPTEGSIHTPFGQWGGSWSWNKGKNKTHPDWGQHGGDDWYLDAKQGHPIYAVANGTIIFADDARKTGAGWGAAFGIHVLNQWDTGGRTSIDAHMVRLAPGIKAGMKVKAGDLIGYLGMTGNVTGPHVHHEQHLGTRWTDKRVKPIYPGRKVTQPVKGNEDMIKRLGPCVRSTRQTISKASTGSHSYYQWLRIKNNGSVTAVAVPCQTWGMVELVISGLKLGQSVWLYDGAYDVLQAKPGRKGKTAERATNKTRPVRIDGVTTGLVRTRVPFNWVLGDQAKGYGYRGLRFKWASNSPDAAIDHVEVSGFYTN